LLPENQRKPDATERLAQLAGKAGMILLPMSGALEFEGPDSQVLDPAGRSRIGFLISCRIGC
jgi:hypothetical protein